MHVSQSQEFLVMSLRVGIDIGSTTVKVVVLDEQNKLLFRS